MRNREYWGLKEWKEEKSARGRWRQSARIREPVVVILLFCLVWAGAAGPMGPAYAASHSFTSTTIYADGTRTAKFKCNGMTGLCCEAGAYSNYRGTASLSRLKNSHKAAYCAYYYGYCKGWTSGSKAHKLARLLSYCMGHGTGGDYKASTMKSLLKTAKKTPVPAGFECWLCKPKGSSKQDFIVWKCPKGKLKVTKASADSALSKMGSYSLAGMTIRVYSDAACKSCVKTLTTKSSGTTGGAFSLPAGTYYVKETAVPEKTGYEINRTVFKVKVTAGKTAKVKVANRPAVGSVQICKETTGEGGLVEGFRFVLTGKISGKKYTLVTGPDGTAFAEGLPLGTYTLTEEMTEEQQKAYTDSTGPQQISLARGSGTQDIKVNRENVYQPDQSLKIIKKTGDGGPSCGFSFRIAWRLDDARTITGEEIAAAAEPRADLAQGQSLGLWQIGDGTVIDRINEDAKAGRTGSYEILWKNQVTTTAAEGDAEEEAPAEGAVIHTEEDGSRTVIRDVEIPVKIRLTEAAGEDGQPVMPQEEKEIRSGGLTFHYRDLVFAGAATTGEESLLTGRGGQILMDQVRPGTYTISEELTDQQKKRYRQPESRQLVIRPENEGVRAVTFVNEPILVPVRLQKTSADGRIEGMEFTLSGKADYEDQPMEEIRVRTDEKGIADFGMLPPGDYTVEETGFDSEEYANAYPCQGKEGPAIPFRITGDELTPEEIEEGKCLWLGGPEKEGLVSEEKVSFRNVPYVELWLTKVDGITRSFLPGARFCLQDSEGKLAARFGIDADSEDQPVPVMLQTNGIITGAQDDRDEETSSRPVLVGGTAVTSDAAGEEEEQVTYPCVVLRGLIEGERYTLTEEEAPEGFTPLEDPYVFSVSLDEKGEPVLNTCDEYGTNIAETTHRGSLVIVNDAPSIGTVAADSETGEHLSMADEKVLLTDHCRVTNLTPGETYTLVARLMDTTEYRKTGNVDDVRPVTDRSGEVRGSASFEADAASQVVEVPIRLSAEKLAGRSTVLYESLYTGKVKAEEADRKMAVAEESDPGSRSQSVDFPRIRTTASVRGEDLIEDRVSYQGLLPGRTYIMKGRLIDRASGEEIEGSGVERRFQPGKRGGSMTLQFAIDPRELKERGITEIVVFESCFIVTGEAEDGSEERKLIAAHEDVDDQGQTVRLSESPPTGDLARGLWAAMGLASTALLLLMMIACRQKRRGVKQR